MLQGWRGQRRPPLNTFDQHKRAPPWIRTQNLRSPIATSMSVHRLPFFQRKAYELSTLVCRGARSSTDLAVILAVKEGEGFAVAIGAAAAPTPGLRTHGGNLRSFDRSQNSDRGLGGCED